MLQRSTLFIHIASHACKLLHGRLEVELVVVVVGGGGGVAPVLVGTVVGLVTGVGGGGTVLIIISPFAFTAQYSECALQYSMRAS